MHRPPLKPVPLLSVWPPRQGRCYMTMSIGQWDVLLQSGYELGFVLVELDDCELPVAAYCNGTAPVPSPIPAHSRN